MKIINRWLGVRAKSNNRLLAAGEQTSTLHILPALSTSLAENAGPLLLLLLHRVHPLSRLYLFLCNCSCDIPYLDNLLLHVSCQPVNSSYAAIECIAESRADFVCSTVSRLSDNNLSQYSPPCRIFLSRTNSPPARLRVFLK